MTSKPMTSEQMTSEPDLRGRRDVFVSLVCQSANLGDLVIRREMVRWLDDLPGTTPHVLVGRMPADFIEACDITHTAVRYTSTWAWERALLRAASRRGGAALVFAPGPQILRSQLATLAHEGVNLVNVAALHRRHNPVVKLGRSLRGTSRAAVAVERGIAHRCAGYWVRDTASLPVVGLTPSISENSVVQVAPDISLNSTMRNAADAPTDASSAQRTVVAISPRAGGSCSAELVRRIAAEVAEANLELTIVTQVRSDESFHAHLAEAAGCRHVAWGQRSSAEQLAVVEQCYGQSLLVTGDRLHALLFGLRLGATPVLPAESTLGKCASAFDALGWMPEAPRITSPVSEWLAWRSDHVAFQHALVHNAAVSLAGVRSTFRQLLVDGHTNRTSEPQP